MRESSLYNTYVMQIEQNAYSSDSAERILMGLNYQIGIFVEGLGTLKHHYIQH